MDRFRKLSLSRQILFLVLMMLVILLISFVISNQIAEQIVERKVTDSVDKILLQVEEKMTSFYSDMGGISTSILYSPTIQTLLKSEDKLSVVFMNDEVTSMFANTMSLKENIRGIRLYNSEGTMMANTGSGIDYSTHFPVQSTEYSGIISTNDSYYTIAVPIYNLKSAQVSDYIGACIFIMDVSNFNSILKSAKITPNSRFLLLDQNNKIMASEGTEPNINTVDLAEWKNDKRYIVQTVTLSNTGWKLISAIPKDELLQDLNMVQRLNIATYLVMICLLGLFLLLFFTRIMRPIKDLMDFMRSYPKRGGVARFNIVYHNEIGVLAANLNKMLDEIGSLGKEIQLTQSRMYEIEIAKNQMEISAFRNQINPHFLYNTLECIRALTFYNKVEDIAEITASLSNMFRYSVKGNDFVTIQDEILHVQEYAKIIGFRFMGRIRVEIEADEGLRGMKSLKMLLQPIVENAVFHGLEKKRGDGIVQITVQLLTNNRVQYIVQDNGSGMDESQLQELHQHLKNSEAPVQAATDAKQGIGLANIYRRIKLFYGNEAEMKIQSQLNEGTIISISILASEESK
ncbi:hypothetical protein ASG89_34030 [Paenibacillus sp. Soil766]|uniref:sensor histidine kinase n=1 Tax=Paenibacillus sp. Soil766 TaxID=1736404 RepID=UPI00070C71BD|nr:sensor histidine kinase [Paenibacillus sp. Soil766]KRE92076.1 hypothetical protein ASG89_34030 [Paenibacillus sp. Soil766]